MRSATRFFKYLPFIAGLALALWMAETAFAHLSDGRKWANPTVTFYIGGGPESVPVNWKQQYRNSAQTWTNAPGSFALVETSPTSAQGNFGARHFSQDPAFPDSWYGITLLTGQGTITSASPYLNLDYTWNTDGTQFPDVRTVATHKLGHWVFFIDNCSPQKLLMCATGQIKWNLTKHEKNELQQLYP